MFSVFANKDTRPPLDIQLYSLAPEELAFFKLETGIEDESALKEHIISVQSKAYEIYGYPCIRSFAFTKLKISHMPAYDRVLKLARERSGAILLDIGCCFGNDARKAVVDGWPIKNVVASDLRQGFWDYGHELFRSTPDTFPAAFIPGDAFDPALISPREPFYGPTVTERPAKLSSLTSLTPLQGHISAIHASSFFHLFNEEQQLELAKRVATLVSPEPGSVIFGAHGGRMEKGSTEKGLWADVIGSSGIHMFCHSPESWTELWDGIIFKKGSVKVEAGLKKLDRADLNAPGGPEFLLLWWSVTRL